MPKDPRRATAPRLPDSQDRAPPHVDDPIRAAPAGLLKRYERFLRDWRSKLMSSWNDIERIREVRGEIVAFRRKLRAEGWELRLGCLDVQLKGFRGDDALAEGFRRPVTGAGVLHREP